MKKVFLNEDYEVLMFKVGVMPTNCYLILNVKENKAVVLDPGFYDEELLNFVKENNITIEFILLTHGHFDHILGANSLNAKTTYINEKDKEMLQDSFKNAGFVAGILKLEEIKNLKTFKDCDEINFLKEHFKVIATPGHTKGSSCFVFLDEVIFTGDTLFKESVGRTDLYGGDSKTLKNSLLKLKNLKKDYVILPGHGKETTLNYEKINNLNLI